MKEIKIKKVISTSKPRRLRFYTLPVLKRDKKGRIVRDKGKVKFVTDKDGKPEKEPVTCYACNKPVKKGSFVKTVEAIVFIELTPSMGVLNTKHLPVHINCIVISNSNLK